MDLKQQTVQTYNKTASLMANKFNSMTPRVEDINRAFLFVEKENPFVLEIGFGSGRDAVEIFKRTNKYLGIDISEPMVDEARLLVPEGKFIVADVDEYIFPKGIDIIFSSASLIHSKQTDLEKIFLRAYDALSLRGIIYLSMKFGDGVITKTDEFGTRTYHLYSPEDIEKIAGDGYESIYSDYQDILGQKWFTLVLRKLS
jgi:SAM-dependent methyltransferase